MCCRPDKEDKDDDDYVLNTTPGFRKHVSRKLSEIIDRYSFGLGVFGSGWGWMEWRVGEDRWTLCSEYSFRLRKTCPENLVRSLTGTVLVCVCVWGGGGGKGGRGMEGVVDGVEIWGRQMLIYMF